MLDSSTIDNLGHKQLADIALHADRLLPCLSPAVCSENCAQALSRRCSDKANVSESEMQAGSCSMETLIERLQTSLYAIQDAAEGMCFCTADQALMPCPGLHTSREPHQRKKTRNLFVATGPPGREPGLQAQAPDFSTCPLT